MTLLTVLRTIQSNVDNCLLYSLNKGCDLMASANFQICPISTKETFLLKHTLLQGRSAVFN